MKRLHLGLLIASAVAMAPTDTGAGAFIGGTEDFPNRLLHQNYSGAGGQQADVTVCVDISVNPDLAIAAEPAIHNVIATYNRFHGLAEHSFAFWPESSAEQTRPDFESVLLHEFMHAHGLDHPQHANNPAGAGSAVYDATRSTDGANNLLDHLGDADGLPGSADDQRGDDLSLSWFVSGVNDPGVIPAVVDRTTMSRELADLPAGHSFVANGNAAVMAALGYVNSESAAHQGHEMGQVQRHLHSEDITTLRLARAGIDGIAGTADDYVHQARYVGRLNDPQGSECRAVVRFVDEVSFASTFVGTTSIADGHLRLVFPTRMRFNPQVDWYFTPGANTTVQIVDTPDPSTGDSPYSVQVTVAKAAYNGMSGTPQGEVEVRDGPRGDALTASCRMSLNAGSGSCQLVPRALGRRTLTADYLGHGGWDGSSATATRDVVETVAFSAITQTPNPSVLDAEVEFAWELLPQGSGLPLALNGEVTVKEAADCASPPVDPAHQCSARLPDDRCRIRFGSVGSRAVQLCYGGDTLIMPASATLTQTVDPGRSTVTALLAQTPSTSAPFAPYTVQLQVREQPDLGGLPQGVVVVSDGPDDDPLSSRCQAMLSGTAGETTSCVLGSVRAGERTLRAAFAAQGLWAASSAQGVQLVRDFRIASHLPAASRVGEAVSVVVTLDVRPFLAAPAPSGNIVVSDGIDHCTIVLPASECLWRGSTLGTRALVATWAGSGPYAGGSTPAVLHSVLPAAPDFPRQLSLPLASFPESGAASTSSGRSLSADGRFVVFSSLASNLVEGDSNGVEDVFVRDQLSGAVRRVSVAADGTEGNSASQLPAISANGRYVAFTSQASTLMPGDGGRHVYVKDLYSGAVTRATALADGSLPPQAESNFTTLLSGLSADGRYVVFPSSRSLAAGDNNVHIDVYVKDMQTGALDLISSDSAGLVGDAASHFPAISADGRHVAFISTAGNLVPNFVANPLGNKIFIKDRQTRSTRLVSATSAGVAANGACGDAPALSADGRYVAFRCSSPNLPANGPWTGERIFVKDMQSGALELISHPSYSNALVPAISADGRYVVFQQGRPGVGTGVYVRDRQTQTLVNQHVTLAGADAGGEAVSWEPRMWPAISADGRFVSFQSVNAQLVAPDLNAAADVFVRDRVVSSTQRASAAWSGVRQTGDSGAAAISRDGETVVFASHSRVLVADDSNGRSDVFLRRRADGALQRVSVAADGSAGNGDSFAPAHAEDSGEVFFLSAASNLIGNDSNGKVDVFAKRLVDGTVERVSNTFGLQSPVDALGQIAVSRDGRQVVITSADGSQYLGSSGDSNGFLDVVLLNRGVGGSSPLLVSRGPSGIGNGDSVQGSISDDGLRIAFASDATNFGLDGGSAVRDVFVFTFRPGQAGLQFLASSDASGTPGNGHSEQPSISPDGRYVAFVSDASNLVPGDSNGARDVFLKDLQTGTIERLNTSSSGAEGSGGGCSAPALGAGARYVSFVCQQSGLVAQSSPFAQLYLKDRVTGTLQRLSESAAGLAADADSRAGARALSDAGLAVFDSHAKTLTGLDTVQLSNVYLVAHTSEQAASTTLITATTPAVPRPGEAYAVQVEVSSAGPTPASGQVSIVGALSSCVATLTPGTPSTGSCNLTTSSTGAYTLKASYGGDATTRTSVSPLYAVEVPDLVLPGKHTITSVVPGNGRATVDFGFNGVGTPHRDYTATCGGVSVVGSTRPIVVQPLSNGVTVSCTVTARNDLGMGPASDPVTTTPIALTTSSFTASPPDPARVGVAHTVAVAVDGEGVPPPAGEVTVAEGGNSCVATLIPGTPSVGSCQLAASTRGSKTVVASYAGDAANRPSSASASYLAAEPAAAPVLGSATPANARITLGFTAPGDTGGLPVLDYTATCGTRSVTASASPIAVTDLVNGVAVSCSVSARNALGSGAVSNLLSATPRTTPSAPTLVSVQPGDASATLSFSASNSDGGSPIIEYRALCGSKLAVGAGSPLTVTGLVNGTSVNCFVLARNAAGPGAASAVIAVTPRPLPAAPVLLSVQAGDRSASLDFEPPADAAASSILDYTATCGTQTATGSASPLQVTGLANGVAVNCSVVARNSSGSGAASNLLTVTPRTLPAAPVLDAVQAQDGAVLLSFTPSPDDGGSVVLDYTARCAAQSTTGSASPLLVNGLANGVEVQCSVTARNAVGSSLASNTLAVTPDRGIRVPGAPVLGSAVAGNGHVSLQFSAPADNGGSAVLDYTARCGAGATTGTASPLRVDDLANGVAVDCSVVARNAAGSSPASNTLTATPANVPAAPLLEGVAPLASGARIRFAAPADDGGSAVLDYEVACLPGPLLATGVGSPIEVSGLQSQQSYRCRVRARNTMGFGAFSAEGSVIPGQPGASADLAISKSNHSDYVNDAEPVRYLITVRNEGPGAVVGARVEDALAPDFAAAQWQCEADATAWCPPSGSGALDIRVDLPAQTGMRIRFDAVPAVVGAATPVGNVASVTPPVGIDDPRLGNNVAMDGPDLRRVFRDGFEAPREVRQTNSP
jgi:Tol biopolymer transport system component